MYLTCGNHGIWLSQKCGFSRGKKQLPVILMANCYQAIAKCHYQATIKTFFVCQSINYSQKTISQCTLHILGPIQQQIYKCVAPQAPMKICTFNLACDLSLFWALEARYGYTTHPAIIIFPMAIHHFLIASYLSPPLDTFLSQILLQVIRPNYINIFTALALCGDIPC